MFRRITQYVRSWFNPSPKPAPAPTYSGTTVDASKWEILYSKNMPARPSPAAGGGFYFDFPQSPGEIDYLMTKVRIPAPKRAFVSLQIDVTGAPVFQGHRDKPEGYCTGDTVACRFMLEKRGDRHTAQDGRFWCQTPIVLRPGAVTLEVPLTDLSRWSNVNGKLASERQAGFAALLKDIGMVGLTFGGCGNFGHGANIKGGTARMTIRQFIVE